MRKDNNSISFETSFIIKTHCYRFFVFKFGVNLFFIIFLIALWLYGFFFQIFAAKLIGEKKLISDFDEKIDISLFKLFGDVFF